MSINRPIKICAVTTISKTMDWFVVDSMRNLAAHDYEVTLVCDMDSGFADRNSDYATCIDLKMKRGANIKDLLSKPFAMRRIFKQGNFDIVYCMSPNASFYASMGGWMARVPVRIYAQTGLRYVSFTGVRRNVFRFIERMTCRFATHVKAQSPQNRLFAIDEKLCGSEKISVVGIGGTVGVDLRACDVIDRENTRRELKHRYGIPDRALVYGYLGRINVDKGVGELIEAFECVQLEFDNVYLILVGMLDEANPVSPDLMDRAMRNERILFTGNVPPDEVYSYMAVFDILVHPTYREGFGKVLQEAMGMRLPIITTNVPGPSEVIEEGVSGILVEAKNAKALSGQMKRLAEDEELRTSLAVAGRKRAEKYFDRPIMLQNFLEDMGEIVERNF